VAHHPLVPLMQPRSLAILGASPRSGAIGNTAVRNIVEYGFAGPVFPIHPTAAEVCGLRCYPDIASLPETPDCVLVAISADKAIPALEEATSHGVKAAVIFASGFSEMGPEGRARQSELEQLARRTGLRVCGPNCLGLANIGARISLYSAALPDSLRAGGVAVLSHSGSGCIVLSSLGRFGFSYLVSAGNCAVLDIADYLDFLADDPDTRVAALFMETVREPQKFAAAASRMRESGKPVVALKVGRSEKGAAAAAAHTGSLAGTQAIYDDFFRRNGVISVGDLDELVESLALMLAIRKHPRGHGLGVINVSGGEIALTCDLAQRIGVSLPELTPASRDRIQAVLPSFGRASNPVDVTGAGVFDMAIYQAAIESLAADPAVAMVAVSQDCPLHLGAHQAETYRRIAATAAQTAAKLDKPLVFYSNVAAGIHPRVAAPLEEAGVPALQGARASLLAMRRLCDYSAHLRGGLDKASSGEARLPPEQDRLWRARLASGAPLTEREAKVFLASFGIAVTREMSARSAEQAVAAAHSLSFPVALKIESPDLPHKSDVGGVRLNLKSAEEVVAAFDEVMATVRQRAPQARLDGVLVQEMASGGVEAIAGLSRHEPFGIAVVVGSGGVLVELVKDSALGLVPVGMQHATAMIDATRLGRLLGGYRGARPGDAAALAELLVKLSQIAVLYGDVIEALDLNPVHVRPQGDGICVVDALLIPRRPIKAAAEMEQASVV